MDKITVDDNRFEVIEKARERLLLETNIVTSADEMKVLDNFLFRCWQMGWLDKYDRPNDNSIRFNIEIIDGKNHMVYTEKSKLDIDNLDQLKIKSVDALKLRLQYDCDKMKKYLDEHFNYEK